MPQNKINVAVIGSGFGLSTHMPAFARCSNVNLYSFFSRQKTLRKEINTKYNLVNFPSLDSMFDDEGNEHLWMTEKGKKKMEELQEEFHSLLMDSGMEDDLTDDDVGDDDLFIDEDEV